MPSLNISVFHTMKNDRKAGFFLTVSGRLFHHVGATIGNVHEQAAVGLTYLQETSLNIIYTRLH